MKTYIYKVTHDKGQITLMTKANTEAEAKRRIIESEGCPACALQLISK